MKITAIVLASGFSRRFKGNKLLAVYEEKPLIRHIVDKIIKQDFHEIIMVSQYDEILNLVKNNVTLNSKVKAIRNSAPQKGISESIKLGIKSSDPCDAYMFFVGDMPLIKEETIGNMVSTYKKLDIGKAPILCPIYEGQRGNPTIFAKQYKEEFLNLQGDIGGRQIIARHSQCIINYEISHKEELWDIDTQLDYEQLFRERETIVYKKQI